MILPETESPSLVILRTSLFDGALCIETVPIRGLSGKIEIVMSFPCLQEETNRSFSPMTFGSDFPDFKHTGSSTRENSFSGRGSNSILPAV